MDDVPAPNAARRDQYAQIEARLVDEYGAGRAAAVRHVIAEERRRFTDARIHAFVPILVERSVRVRLGHRAAVVADSAP
ncbi:three-helix bundle dimerization domain-containing protein [Actinophytocola sp.]|uniref:three-helix bundle dimerization domain-containing protein n=1 Tax=Actinophytocola sp. TaxID=1872138 RepID=UPI002ED43B86